jgi:hypothetical protein
VPWLLNRAAISQRLVFEDFVVRIESLLPGSCKRNELGWPLELFLWNMSFELLISYFVHVLFNFYVLRPCLTNRVTTLVFMIFQQPVAPLKITCLTTLVVPVMKKKNAITNK